MKILYFGTVCDLEKYNEFLKECKSKPSIAPILFETALLDGLRSNNADVEIHCFPMVPTFPRSKKVCFGGRKEKLACGYECRWLFTINLPILKQVSRRLDARRVIKKWAKNNDENGVIFTYSIPPFLVKDIVRYAKKNAIKSIALVPDLLRDMYINEKYSFIKQKLKNKYLKSALKVQGEYDGYIYLTNAMHDVVAPDKPYMVMEAIANISNIQENHLTQKSNPKAIMYAGMLHEKYGILNLVKAFEQLDVPNIELWLFGDGNAVPYIKERASVNSKIKYYGQLNHDEIVEYEKKATLLVNPRNPQDEFTFYSFPSKTIEYMLSGTPVLTTKLKGIPEEYYTYVFSIDNNEVEAIEMALKNIFCIENEELLVIGKRAQDYVRANKNSHSQAKRIISFIEEV